MPPTSDQSISKKDWKDHLAFISPDEENKAYFVPLQDAKKIIKRGEWDRTEFLTELKKRSKYEIECNALDIEASLALTLGDTVSSKDGHKQRISPCVQSYGLNENIVAQYSVQKAIDIVDCDAFIYLIHHVMNGHSTSRTCSKNTGLFFNKGTNSSNRPRLDPRKDDPSKKKSERWTGSRMIGTFAPLLFELIEMLARFSNKMSRVIDRVVHQAYMKVYQEIIDDENGKSEMKHNLNPAMDLSSLQIVSCADKNGINFSNGGHIDIFDANDERFNEAMEQILIGQLIDWCEQSKKGYSSPCSKKWSEENLDAILYLLKCGRQVPNRDDEHDEPLKFTTDTTCGYQPIYRGDCNRKVFAGFLYPKNKTLIRFGVGKVTFQKWNSNLLFHQTPVCYTYDDDKIYLKDKDLIILAWGAGTANVRQGFLQDQNINYNGSIRSTRQLCDILRANGAPQAAYTAASTTFSYNQRFITEYYRTNVADVPV